MRRRSLLALVGGVSVTGCVVLLDDVGQTNHFDMRGEIDIVIDGEPVDLTTDRFQVEYADDAAQAFHLHEDDAYWHMAGQARVTAGEAIELLPHFEYDRQADHDVITFDGESYDGADPGTLIEFFANDVEVDPQDYALHHGDALRVDILTNV